RRARVTTARGCLAHRHSPLERSAGRRVSPHRLSRSCKRRADGRIDRSEVRDSPWDPLAEEGRVVVWSSRRGNHLGQRSKVTASTGRTYGRKRSDQTVEKTLVARGPSTYGSPRSRGRRLVHRQICTLPPPPSTGPPCAVVLNSRWHPRSTGRQPPVSQTIWPDACGRALLSWGRGRSRTARSGRSSSLRFAVGVFARRFSHSLSSLRNEPSAQTIRLQRSPSGLKPCSQTSGQTRDGLSLIASSASVLASLTLSLVPACRLNSAIERCDAAFHSPSAAPLRQPTR